MGLGASCRQVAHRYPLAYQCQYKPGKGHVAFSADRRSPRVGLRLLIQLSSTPTTLIDAMHRHIHWFQVDRNSPPSSSRNADRPLQAITALQNLSILLPLYLMRLLQLRRTCLWVLRWSWLLWDRLDLASFLDPFNMVVLLFVGVFVVATPAAEEG